MKYIDTDFFLTSALRDKFNKKIEDISDNTLNINFTFKYEPDMIDCNYEYALDKDDVNKFLSLLAQDSGFKFEGNIINFLDFLDLIISGNHNPNYLDPDTVELLNETLDNLDDKLMNELKNFCKDKAFEEFKAVFDYFNDEEEDRDLYYELGEL